MHSLTIQPSQVLQDYVRHIEILENDQAHLLLTPLPFYADGCPGLIYQQTDNGMLFDNGAKKLSDLFVYGQTVKPIEFLPQGAYRMIIFYFYPHVIKSLYGISSSEVTDTCLDLSLVRTPTLMESIHKLQDTQSAVQQVEIISTYLTRIILANKTKVDGTVLHAINHIIKNNGQSSLKELRTWLKVSERTFERKFDQHVGVNAKLFARICQFKSSLTQLYKKNFSKLSDLAYDNGYADQSHFIRSFKEFTGLSPLEFKKQLAPPALEEAEMQ
jgi:AraC-like DNA-binding protein